MKRPSTLFADRSGSAAVEMALVFPILLVLMLGAVDVGYFFMSEHVVDKAVRDASRYAARLPFASFNCGTNTMTDPSGVQRLARTGSPNGTVGRLPGWTSDGMTTVSVNCDNDNTHTWVNNGIYKDFPNSGEAPVVTVSATVPYNSFFGALGLPVSLNLNGRSEAALIGA